MHFLSAISRGKEQSMVEATLTALDVAADLM